MKSVLSLRLNGRSRDDVVADNVLLVDYLREICGLTGTKIGCDGGECGACTVLVDGEPTLSCLLLAVEIDGAEITTVEAVDDARLLSLQRSFVRKKSFRFDFNRCVSFTLLRKRLWLRDFISPLTFDILIFAISRGASGVITKSQ